MTVALGEQTSELAEPPSRTPQRLDYVVPGDPWRHVRVVLMAAYGVAYVWWFLNKGLIIDRISVGISVFIFLVCAFVGKPWRRWGWLLVEAVLYAAMWGAYESTRGGADGSHEWFGVKVKFPIQVETWRNVDRFIFFGHDPNVVLQDHFYNRGVVHWYDQVASTTYFSHFIFPVIAMAALWAGSQLQWRRFMKRFATLLFAACIMFVLLPSAPPWMVSSRSYPYRLFKPVGLHTASGFYDLGFKGFVEQFSVAQQWGNAIAAMPSLHSAFSLIVPAFFLPWIKPKWLRAIVLLFPVVMLTSLVYFGEHWVIDGLVGWTIVGLSFLFWGKVEARTRRRKVALSLAGLVGIDGTPPGVETAPLETAP
jgi:membrane-associated phospholipid phosphatase